MMLYGKRHRIMVLGVLIVGSFWGDYNNVKAASAPQHNIYRENVECGDVIGGGEIQMNTFPVTRGISANGNVIGNGVRLRKLPKKTATVLELLYNREYVCINYTKSAQQSSGDWYYVKRVKTGTWGWISNQYLTQWD